MINYKFVLSGTFIEDIIKENLYLDVGNSLREGVVDHHHLQDVQKSATRLVYENPSFISKCTDNIILHNSPDLDCIASSFLAKYYIENDGFPVFSQELCSFLDKVDFGYRTQNLINLNSLFYIVKSKSTNDLEIVQKGHELIESLVEYGFDSGKYPQNLQGHVDEILNDICFFENDFNSSIVKDFRLLNRYTEKYEVIKGLVLSKPKSKLFKYFARDKGFDLLIVKWNNKRTVISLKGDSFYTLDGIGSRFNKAEKQKRQQLNVILNEQNREGYDIPDPWYDGRAHNYTIMDSPRSGTLLNDKEILELIEENYYAN